MSIVPVRAEAGTLALRSGSAQATLTPTTFRELGLKEDSLEELVKTHSELLFPDEEEDFLIVGQQVSNAHRDRADLVGLLPTGSLVVVEVKRDAEDMRARREALEWQAIRYASSIATIRNPEELVHKLYAPFLMKAASEKGRKALTDEALEEVKGFLETEGGGTHFNETQEIILVASEFDDRTLAACSWLVKSGIPLRCVQVSPHRYAGAEVLLEVSTILPPPALEDWFVEIGERSGGAVVHRTRASIGLHLPELFAAGLVKVGDKLRVGKHTDQIATFVDAETVEIAGQRMSPTQFGLKVTGWSAFSVYGSGVFVNDARLRDLRARLAAELEAKTHEATKPIEG